MNNKISPLLFVFSLIAIFFVLFNFSLTNMAAVYIIGDLGSNNFTSPYTISFFGIGNAVSIPLADFLRKKVGFRRAILYPMALFTLLSFLTATIQNYPLFLFFRFLQGLSSGPLFLLFNSLILNFGNEYQQEEFPHYVLLIFLTSSVVSAALGGVIAYIWSWHLIFVVDGALLFVTSIFLYKELINIEDRIEPVSLDWIGFIFFSIAVISLVTFVTVGQELDWFRSPLLTTLFIIGLPSLIYFIIRSCYHEHPVVSFSLCKSSLLSFALIQVIFLFSSYFGLMILLALWLSLDVNYTPYWIAVALLTMTAGAMLFIRIIWKERYRSSLIILGMGILLIALSCFYSQKFNVEIDFKRIAIARILAGFGFVMFLPPLFCLIVKSYAVEYRLQVFTLFQLSRVISSSCGAALYTTLWQRRAIFYHERLGEELTAFSPLTKNFFEKLSHFKLSPEESLVTLSSALSKQCRSLALDDCLYLIGWIMVALLIYLLYNYKLQKATK